MSLTRAELIMLASRLSQAARLVEGPKMIASPSHVVTTYPTGHALVSLSQAECSELAALVSAIVTTDA